MKLIGLFTFIVIIALVIKIVFRISNGYHPERKQLTTFSGFRILDRYMLLWPFLGILALFF